jgi:tetratricopeptide (TPR) repeat protein
VTYINYAQPIVVAQAPAVVVAPQTTFSPADTETPTLAAAPPNTYPVDGDSPDSDLDNDVRGNDPPDTQDQALGMFDSARALFKRGDYKMALSQADRAVALLPNDPMMHEFRSLCLFAMKDYGQAAAAAYAVLSVGPGWDKETLEGLYNNMAVYQMQLKELEAYRDANPNAANARFLLAYHQMLNGRNEQAIEELKTVVQLQPKDRLAAQLLKGLTAPEEAPDLKLEAPGPTVAVDGANLPGKWTAEREDGAKITLTITADQKFTWTVASEEKPQELSGTYTFADNYLILSAPGQSALVGQLSMASTNEMTFKLAGGSPHDPGLKFVR